MLRLGLFFGTILLSFLCVATEKPEFVNYYNYAPSLATQDAGGYARISVPVEDGVGWYVNTPKQTKYCGEDSKIRCVKVGELVLTAPRGGISIDDNWVLEGRNFRVVSMGKLSLLGEVIPYFEVESSMKDDSYRYLINHCLGVIAIIWPSRTRDESGEAYILGTSKGVLSENKGAEKGADVVNYSKK